MNTLITLPIFLIKNEKSKMFIKNIEDSISQKFKTSIFIEFNGYEKLL